ncbi:keratin, type II cytoskeletal 2 epidermal-like [Strongylocentrotus purpuratus]|uniref:Uncharacterized protein n=1 Tax=Strongylocentrotus purpuratus TaxID=7668 RepID=A0A7M7P4E6_STRPU|nr:keratin, type II cytoskeletal 2 epidermal-like [Strongylocentrotus purpuratus]
MHLFIDFYFNLKHKSLDRLLLASSGANCMHRYNMSSSQPESQVRAGADRMGYGPDGIRPGSAAADHMSSEAKLHGGKIPSGSPVSHMQSSGSKGQSSKGGSKGQITERHNKSSSQPESQVRAGADRMGYGPSGIRPGTAAANHMSSEAKRHGGKVPAGSPVSKMQSSGSKDQSSKGGSKGQSSKGGSKGQSSKGGGGGGRRK